MWKVPLFDISYDEKESEAALDVIRSGWLTMSTITQEFEKQFAEFLGVKHAIAVSNGTAALHLANLAVDISAEDEVICPALTFVAGANSILYTGAIPIFSDIESKDNLCVSPKDIEKKITKRTKAIQVMHYAGFPCDMDSITEIAEKNRLYIIEDCAHAPGTIYKEKKCGTIGDIGCFSFFSNKNLSIGEGGIVTTNSDTAAEKIRSMRSHGMTSLSWDRARGHAFSYDVVKLGFNYRIDEIRSAIALVQLKKLSANNRKREKFSMLYRERLSMIEGIELTFNHAVGTSVHHIFPVLLHKNINRLEFMEYLKSKRIQTSIHYPPIHQFDYYRRMFGNRSFVLPVTDDVAKREVTLPLYPGMGENEIDYVCDMISKYLNNIRK